MSRTSDTSSRAWPSGAGGLALVGLLAALPYLFLPAKPLLHDAALAVERNPVVLSGSLVDAFTTDFWGAATDAPSSSGSYRPLVTLTYLLQVRALGLRPAAFHVVDLAVHAGVVALFCTVLGTLSIPDRWRLPAALAFAWHPLASEAVASVVGRADLLAAGALLAALALHLRARTASRPWACEAGALAALAAGMLCKEYAVSFPFLLIVVDLALGGTDPPARRRRAAFAAAALAVLAAYLLFRQAVLGSLGGVPMLGPADQPLYGASWIARGSTASWVFARAVGLVIAPVGLNHYYAPGSLPVIASPLDPRALAGLALLASAVVAAARSRLRGHDPIPAIAVALFVLPLAPSLNTVSIAGVLFAERWMYLPTAGAALGFAWVLARVAAGDRAARRVRLAGLAIVLVLAGLTARRVEDWTSAESLARSSLRAYPDAAKIWNELGLALGRKGNHGEAAAAFERSLALEADDPRTWKNRATALTNLGRLDEAADAWRQAVERSPGDVAPLLPGLAAAELRAARRRLADGDRAGALARAKEAAALAVLSADERLDAGLIALAAGDAATSAAWFAEALAQDPDVLRRRHEAALERERAGRPDEAAELLRGILAARPDHAATWFNLGRVLTLSGRPSEGAEALRRGLALQDDPRARALLDRALADAERTADPAAPRRTP